MNEKLKAVAACYASALKASEQLTTAGDCGRPSAVDIWLWKLEEVAAALVENWKGKQRPEHPGRYDQHHLYAHRYCLNSKEDVQNAPDSVLFEMMGLSPSQELGWLQFMVRELGWHSMIAANWGLPVLKIPDGVTYDTTTEAQRRAQAVTYYLELMRERGCDPLAKVRNFAESMKARFRERYGRELDEKEFTAWMERRRPWIHFLYAHGDKPNPSKLLTTPGEPKYVGDHRARFAAEIREAAARRRRNSAAVWSCDCSRLTAERDEAEGREAERVGGEHVLKGEVVMRRGEDIGVAPDGELLPRLVGHLEAWTSAEYHIRNAYLKDRLEIFLARNAKARDLLRLPENRELALRVKKEVRWLYVPA